MTDQTIETAADVLVAYWIANKGNAYRTVLEGEQYDPDETEPFYELEVLEEGREQETLGRVGNRRFLSKARFYLRIHYPVQISGATKGSRPISVLAKEARDVFEGKTISGLRLFAVEVRQGPTDGKWIRRLVTGEFDYQERK